MPNHPIVTIGEVMTPGPETIDIDATLSQAEARLNALGVRHLPVMDGELVESVISDRDIKRFTLPAHKLSPDEELLVRDIVPPRAYVADIQDPLERVLHAMIDYQSNAVIVLDQGDLAGIFTETDACKVLAAWLGDKA